ncbi:MAG TPA: T9SS type A sorting domain-containing protein, partial [Flavobacteriales bacterium]|nr:T9SS type A sorting domain-containing protein [Flavobacteriales bacterium]
NGCTLTGSQLDVNEPGALMGVMSSTSESSAGASDGTAMITVSGGTSPYFYVWSTNPVQNLATATGLSSGVYGVAVTDANGCTYSDSVSVGLGSVGLTYITNKLLVNLYPNPVRNELYIDLNTENDLRFEIYNVIGDQIKSTVFNASNNRVSTNDMATGLYFYYISDASGMVYHGKFNIIK